MITINFYLDKKPYRKEAIIFMYFRYSGNTLKYNTRLSILPTYWNKNKQRSYSRFKLSSEFNSIIANLTVSIESVYYRLRSQLKREPTTKELREELKALLNPESTKHKVGLVSFVNKYMKEKKAAAGTIKTYKSLLNKLKAFEKEQGAKLSLDSVDTKFLEDFVDFLFEGGIFDNTVAKYISNLRTTLKEAKKQKLIQSTDIDDFIVPRKDPKTKVYLNANELEKIYNLDFSTENKVLEVSRDIFIIACHTGLRYSDFSKLKKRNVIEIEDVELIHTITSKTGTPVYIPIHHQVKALIAKYNGNFPKAKVNQAMNRDLKKIAQLAGIDNEIEKVTEKRNTLIKEVVPKYSLITTHTARRSFATNTTLSKQFTMDAIMKMTGHKKVTTFTKYVKTNSLENALRNANTTFFKGEKK